MMTMIWSRVLVEDLRKKLAHLDAIKAAADGLEGQYSPPLAPAACAGYAASIGVLLLSMSDPAILPIPSSVTPLAALLAFFLVMIICMSCSKSWLERLDDLIESYDPVDELEYAELQQEVKSARKLEAACVKRWVNCERLAVESRIGEPTGPGTKFMNKNLNKAQEAACQK